MKVKIPCEHGSRSAGHKVSYRSFTNLNQSLLSTTRCARKRLENELPSSSGAMQALLFGDGLLGLDFHPCPNEQRYFQLGRLTWTNFGHTRPRIVAWMTDGRAVGDTLLIECLHKDLRYALSTALSPLPCTDAQRATPLRTAKPGTPSCAPTISRAPRTPSSLTRLFGPKEVQEKIG